MKVICIGLNYFDHISEMKSQKQDDIVFFIKHNNSIIREGEDFSIPNFSKCIHYELEFIARIEKDAKNISNTDAKDFYKYVSVGIDFTARDIQREQKSKGLPWEKAKSFDKSALIGKLFDKNDFYDDKNFDIELLNNGKPVQVANTKNMIFSLDNIISYVSNFLTIEKGDYIFTGTPSGVGQVSKGDVLTGKIESLQAFEININ